VEAERKVVESQGMGGYLGLFYILFLFAIRIISIAAEKRAKFGMVIAAPRF
jgi:cell division protein FtsW (lipid II flippase)